ncbi:MAG: hypothetical protein QXJ64_06875 [Thermosphaera sp.]
MLKRVDVFLLTYTLLTSIINVFLLLLNETRVDAYISVNILVFYVNYAVIRPVRNPGLPWRVLQLTLLCVFAIIVGYRVYEVLYR